VVVQLSLVSIESSEKGENTVCIAFPWSRTKGAHRTFDVCVPPLWDQEIPPKSNDYSSISGVLLGGDPIRRESWTSCIVLLLNYKDSHYERIGYVEYPKGRRSTPSSTLRTYWPKDHQPTPDERPRPVENERPLWLRKKGKFSRIKDQEWVENACWIECVPVWLSRATRNKFLLG
jgi:hypothetical protein